MQEQDNESKSIRKKNVPKLPGYPTQGHSEGNLYGTTAQAASGLTDGLWE